LLVSVTDRIDARRIYVASAFLGVAANLGFATLAHDAPSAAAFMALYGVSLAGTYMPGLRVLGEHLPATMIARATAYYTSSFGLGAAISYVLSDLLAERYGWPAPFVAASAASLLAGALILAVAPPSRPPATSRSWLAVIDPRPVFRNRSAMAYSICYGLHSFELFTVRTWIVAFLAAAAARQETEPGLLAPAAVAALLTLLGMFASIAGSETAIRGGRRRAIGWAMAVSAVLAIAVGSASALAYWIIVVLAVGHGIAIMVDSAALTAGAYGSARQAERGITMAVHSTLGFGGAIVGPLTFGAIVDLFGRDGALGWGLAYGHLGLLALLGPFVLWRLKPQSLPGDRRAH
jgi:MFS family permease